MTKEEHIEYWKSGSQDNLDAALTIYNSKRYDWALYVAHLSLEKILKAHFIKSTDNLVPPKTHNLLKLAKLSGISLDEEQLELLADMNRFQIEARYPRYKNDLNKIATRDFTDNYFKKIKDIFKWLMSQIQ